MNIQLKERLNLFIEQPCIIFIILAFIFGSIFLLKTPPLEVPDEPAHLLRTCEVADGIIYNKTPAKQTKYDKLFKFTYNIGNTNINTINKNYIFKRDAEQFHYASRNSALMYLASSIGIKIGSMFSNNGIFIFNLGRFFNLIVYILLCAFAIKITPIFKYHFLFTALLPMALFQGMSYSADSFNNGFAFLFFAFVFKLIYEEQEITRKNFSILAIFCYIGALCKGLIYPLCLFFTLPAFSKKFKFNKWIYIFSIITTTLILSQIWITINNKNLNLEQNVINDSLYIFKEPLIVLWKIILTTCYNFWGYAFEFIGILGWLQVFLSPITYIIGLLTFLSMFIFLPEKIKKQHKIFALLGFITFYSIIQYMLLIYWSDPNSLTIHGIQGRYLIPLAPLLFVSFTNTNLKLNKKFNTAYKILLIIVIVYLLIDSSYTLNSIYNEHHYNRFLLDIINNK